MKTCQVKFAENAIHSDKFKEPCGYFGSEDTVSAVTFVTCEILVLFKRKSETISSWHLKMFWKYKGKKK